MWGLIYLTPATQAQIAELFQTDRTNVTKHLSNIAELYSLDVFGYSNALSDQRHKAPISNIFGDGELAEVNNVKKLHIATSKRPVTLYSLDAVISVGYRVNSKAATRFRQWATQTIKAYIEQGFVINEKVLRESPEKLNRLAAEIRALRSEEKQIYAKVREF